MNRTKIEWCDVTWNPVTGCLHGCEYCFAERIANRFAKRRNEHLCTSDGAYSPICFPLSNGGIYDMQAPLWFTPDYGASKKSRAPYPYGFAPTFHRYLLDEPAKIKQPQEIFVCSMADLFGDWVPDEWIQEVFKACEAAPQHKYLFLTKNFLKASDYRYRDNWWIGRTITNKEDSSKLCSGDPWSVDGIHRANHFLSIEPLLGDVEYLKYYLYSFKWVIIGQQTGPGAKPPKDEWVQSIIDQCRAAGVPVFVKSPLYEKFPIQEWPEGLKGVGKS